MSKVHEALKRAQEERSSAALQVAETATTNSVEATSTILEIPAVDPGPSDVTHSSPSEKRVLGDAVVTSGACSIVVTAAPVRSEASMPSVPSAKAPMPPVLSEHRPHAPAAGRDPRTGQFLRFEDLLKCCAKPAWVLDPRTVAFCESNEHSGGTEQFRTLRTRLYQLRETAPLKRILVTSALAGEGKTFVASNLAQAFAKEKERKVLLIDGDLRSPALHKHLAAPSSLGLSDYLRGQASDPEIIQHGQDGNLCFIAAGSSGSDPSELLSNGMLDKLLDRLAPLFDWVIVDSPPCLPVSDANVLASLCDGVLLVLRAKTTPAAAAEKARKELQKRKVVGVVMNAVEETDAYGAYYAYGYGNKSNGKGPASLKLT
jgi:capsular exopolysaccharide synthesis family protein